MEYNPKYLQEVLRKAIGSSSIVDFAAKCGLSRTHLGRILNNENTPAPSKNTLKKIADHSDVDYDDLLSICGYASSPADARKQRPFEERAKLNVYDLEKGFTDLTRGCRLYDSIDDFLETYNILYSYEDCKYGIGQKMEYDGDLHPGMENCVNVSITFKDQGAICNTFAVIYFAETKGGKIVILNTAFDGKSLLEAKFASKEHLKSMHMSEENIAGLEYVYYVAESAESRLLRTIFGEKNGMKRYPYTVEGFGFEVENVPEKFDEFLEKHKDLVFQDPDDENDEGYREFLAGERKRIEDYLNLEKESRNPEEYFKDYKDFCTENSGFQAIIANIMSEETGMNFSYYVPDDELEYTQKCVMVEDGLLHYGLDEMKKITEKYARDLGIKKYGSYIVYTYRYEKTKYMYEVKEED